MFIHLTDTCARFKGGFSIKTLMIDHGYQNSLFSYAYKIHQEQWTDYYKMLIHLAESSAERGQYQALLDRQYPSHLMSYHYKNICSDEFKNLWEMLIYLAGNKACESPEIILTQADTNTLMSYEDKRKLERKMNIYLAEIRQNPTLNEASKGIIDSQLSSYAYKGNRKVNDKLLPRILIDSGAFTAFTTGKKILVSDYGRWALDFKKQWEHRVKSLNFFNLDVIGDQLASNNNLHRLETMGLNPIPIFTYKADTKELLYYLTNYEYFGLGGLVGLKTADQIAWLDHCFKYIIRDFKETGKLKRIHLLGVTKEEILIKYPCYSSDSSSWVSCLRFGGGRAIGKEKIPRYNESPEALKVTIATLRAEIKKYKEMQDRVTKVWEQRGIVWKD